MLTDRNYEENSDNRVRRRRHVERRDLADACCSTGN